MYYYDIGKQTSDASTGCVNTVFSYTAEVRGKCSSPASSKQKGKQYSVCGGFHRSPFCSLLINKDLSFFHVLKQAEHFGWGRVVHTF
jgi:hypothetical protein